MSQTQSSAPTGAATGTDSAACANRNEVVLVGRLAEAPQQRTLASGDTVSTFRIVVRRTSAGPGARRGAARGAPVDTVDCAVWTPGLRRTVGRWLRDDIVSVEGSLRRRFWRAEAGVGSRYEVEVTRASRLRRSP
jgi:single-strand DNA-binding protein